MSSYGVGFEEEFLDWVLTFRSEAPWFGAPGPGGFQVPAPVGLDLGGDAGTTSNAKNKNPPPKTKPGSVALKVKQPAGVEYDLSVEILDDTIDATIQSTGKTTCWWKDWKVEAPAPEYDQSGGLPTVSKIKNTPKVSGVLGIQTSYQKKNAEYLISGYGRGTTQQDKKAGDITLGFHESCHREDYIRYLNTQSLPGFDGLPGVPAEEFNQDWANFVAAFRALPTTASAWSNKLTDEVGIPKARFDASHKKAASAGSKH